MAKYLGRPPLMLQSYQNESKSGKTFIDLPTEIIQNIISRVDGVSALAVRATCKTLRNQVDYLSTTDLRQLQTAFININPSPSFGTSALTLSPLGQKLLLGSPLMNKSQLKLVLNHFPLIKQALQNTNLSQQKLMDIRDELSSGLSNTLDRPLVDELENLIINHPSLDVSVLTTPLIEKNIETIIENQNTPGSILHKLMNKHQDNHFILAVIAGHTQLLPGTAEAIFNRKLSDVNEYLADNSQTPPHILDEICKESISRADLTTLESIAKNTSSDSKTLLLIWQNKALLNPDILRNLSKNTSCSLGMLEQMILNKKLHTSLASNQNLPPALTEQLLKSPKLEVIEALAQFSHTEGITDLLSEPHQPGSVQAATARNIKITHTAAKKLFQTGKKEILIGLVYNPGTGPDIINKLAFHPDKDIYYPAAMSSKLNDDALEYLSKSADPKIHELLLTNKSMQLYFSRI
ncbi:MAG TPA: hypothetical protein DHW71_11405 [Gammaproteobacteria bacterium]|nr:hypothetical protein [Gammaproteobacteria bacterium]HBF09977.1 hypothetical protein [Gammaproteobacteria bacterium]HCK93590.1 hypothetical protein [Gammaproteobacteria bacterium]|tara:strand:+ start:355 stop:1746 length:1392 start_codon:yes stop_codon:yes gene_type:complete